MFKHCIDSFGITFCPETLNIVFRINYILIIPDCNITGQGAGFYRSNVWWTYNNFWFL